MSVLYVIGSLILFISLITPSSFFNTRIIYVDQQLMKKYTENYSVKNLNCKGMDGDAYRTIKSAAAVSGTTVLIRGGVYSKQLNPTIPGNRIHNISFKICWGEA